MKFLHYGLSARISHLVPYDHKCKGSVVRETGLEFDRIIHPRSILPHDVEQRKKNNQYLVVSTNDSKPCVLTVWVRSDDDFAVYQQIYPNQILADESEKGG